MKKIFFALLVLPVAMCVHAANEPVGEGHLVPGTPNITWSVPGQSGTIKCDPGDDCYLWAAATQSQRIYCIITGIPGEWILEYSAPPPPRTQTQEAALQQQLSNASLTGIQFHK